MTSRVDLSRELSDAKLRSGARRGGPRKSGPRFPRLGHRPLMGLASALLLSACGGAERFPQTALDPASDLAREIDGLQDLTIYLAFAVGLAVFLILAYILVHFRYKPGDPQPRQVHGNTQLELAWTLIPAVLIAVIAVPTVRTIFSTQAEAPEGALEVEVYGYQWWWEFRYPLANGDTVVTANEIHVPVGTPVELKMTSRDVIHSFWIPQMGGKRDVIPGRVNRIVFTPLEAGVYLGQCAEFCGESHALMKMRLVAHEPEEFAAWLENEARPAVVPTDSAVLAGQQLVTGGVCAGCHTIRGTPAQFGRLGPDLTHVARRMTIAGGIMDNNAENLHRWINNPPEVKPGALMPPPGLSEQELRYVVAYLQTLY